MRGSSLISLMFVLLICSATGAWYLSRPVLVSPHPPAEAQELIIERLLAGGVPRSDLKLGHYPFFGVGQGPAALLPLISFPCPLQLGCEQLFATVSAPLIERGYTLREPRKLLSAGRPLYRAVAFGEQPVLILRAYPGEVRLAVFLEALGDVAVDPRELLRLDPDCSFAVNPLARSGESIYRLLSRNQREVYLSLPLSGDPSPLAPHATEVFLQRLDRLLDRHDWVGVSAEPGASLLTHHPSLSGLMDRLHQRRQIFIDEGRVFASLGEALGRDFKVRTVRSTHQLPAEQEAFRAQLRALRAELVLSGSAILEVPPQAATLLPLLRAWLDEMKDKGVRLLRLSELAH